MMYNISPDIRAMLDNKRFPKKWHATVGVALMQFAAYAAVFALILIFGTDIRTHFATDFGYNMFLTLISQFVSVLAIPLIILNAAKCNISSTLRLNKRIDAIQMALLVLICIGTFFAAQFINQFAIDGMISVLGEPAQITSVPTTSNVPQLIFEIVITAILPAVCEEIFFRGLVMRAFERTSPVVAVLASSLIFAIMHANLQQLIYAFLFGLILGTVAIISDSLFASMTVHFTLNLASALLTYEPINDTVTAFLENPENGYTVVFYSMLVIPLIAYAAIPVFIGYTRKINLEKYGKPFVSDMEAPALMPKQTVAELLLYLFGWAVFIAANTFSMYCAWKGI